MSIFEGLLASGLIGVGALVQGSIGFGMALIAAPLLLLIDPVFVPGPLLIAALPLALMVFWRERRAVDLAGLRWPIVGQLAGTGAAVGVMGLASQGTIAVLIGLVILVAVGLSAAGLRVDPNPRNLLAAGTLAGFMGTTASIPGPPLALAHQSADAARLRGSLAPFFVVGSALSLTALRWADRLGAAEVQAGLLLVPGMAIGFALSTRLTSRLDPALLRRSVLLLSAASALLLILRSI